MQKLNLFLIVILFFGLVSCSDEDPIAINDLECETGTIDLDTIFLEETSTSFVSYLGDEVLFYKNAIGDEVKFEPLYGSLKHSYYPWDFALQCMNGDSNHYEYNPEQYAVAKKCEALHLQFFLNVLPYRAYHTTLFYDNFSLLLHTPPLDHIIDTSVTLRFVTSLKNNVGFPENEIILHTEPAFVADTMLLNKSFQNIYYAVKGNTSLLQSVFYTKEQGMVAFQDLDEVFWVLDRIE